MGQGICAVRYPDSEGGRYRRCRGIVAVQFDGAVSWDLGVASSRSQVEPQWLTTQSGASRSVSPARAWRAARLWDSRKRGSVVLSWYWSPNTVDGRVRYVWSPQVASLGAGGRLSDEPGMVIDISGCRPVGGVNETV